MRKKIYVFILAFLILFSTICYSQEFMDIEEIKPGMEGTAKTVFSGNNIEEFPVEIISIIEENGLDKQLILIKTGGQKIEEIGGIAAGMSGSPVYIEDKLLGAISYGWDNADSRYALVTPIAEMLDLFTGFTREGEYNSDVTQLKTPLMVSGLTGRALNNLRDDTNFLDFKVLPGSGLRKDDYDSVQPGSAVAVQLARGDINIASIGTVTHVENDNILAFGHSFTNKGKVNYFLSSAYINAIIPSEQTPFKLGAPHKKIIGLINNDRSAGIAGKLNSYPQIIPFNIQVHDQERDITNKVSVQIINDELFFTSLSNNIALQAIDETLDRIGDGTAGVTIEVLGIGLPEMEISRSNLYYSTQDIAAASLSDLYQLINIIFTNPFKEVNVLDIKVDIEIMREDRVALIQEAEVINEEIYPGDNLELEVTLHPYRSEPFTKKISCTLPEDIEPGRTSVVIEGGSLHSYTQVLAEDHQQEDFQVNQAQVSGYKSFQEMIDDFLDQYQNNELIVQVYRGYSPQAVVPQEDENELQKDGEGDNEVIAEQEDEKIDEKKYDEQYNEKESEEEIGKDSPDSEDPEEKPEIKTVEKTDYVLEGSLNLDIEIMEIEKNELNNEEDTAEIKAEKQTDEKN